MPDFESDAEEAASEVAEFKALLKSFGDKGLTIDVDFSQVTAAIAEVEALKAALTDGDRIKQECKFEHRLILDGKELRIIDDKHVEKFRSDS